MDKDKVLAVAVCPVCRLIIKPIEPIKKMGGHPVHVACLSPLTVTCAIAGGLLKVRVSGNYDFEDVKRAITAALDQAEVGSAQAIVYDMREAGFQPYPAEVRDRAAWIGGLRDRGLRVCAVVVVPGSRISGIAVLEEMDMPVRFFSTVATAEDWASTQILTRHFPSQS